MKIKLKPSFPFNPAKWPFYYGWVILFWGTIGILMSMPGQTIGVSVFTDPLIQALGISRDHLSLAYMFGTIGSSFILPWAGRKYDEFGVRAVIVAASLGLGVTLFTLSQIDWIILVLLGIKQNWIIITFMVIVFMFLRFFGQGVLTMASRNMTVQWFEAKRGFATGFSNVFVSLGFSISPVVLYQLIQDHTWKGAWIILGAVAIIVFPILVIVFFRDKPEDSGLIPDGIKAAKEAKNETKFKVVKDFTLKEVRNNFSFWVYALMLAMQGLYITAFTFHVVSVFEAAGLTEHAAIRIFQPTAIIAVVVTLVASTLSDHISVKPLFCVKGFMACLAILGVGLLGKFDGAVHMIIVGNGFMGGLFSVLMSVTWPRYYGRLHLGAISGQAISLVVFASALGPIIFSQSMTLTNSYDVGALVCFTVYLILTVAVFWTRNPQKHLLGS